MSATITIIIKRRYKKKGSKSKSKLVKDVLIFQAVVIIVTFYSELLLYDQVYSIIELEIVNIPTNLYNFQTVKNSFNALYKVNSYFNAYCFQVS